MDRNPSVEMLAEMKSFAAFSPAQQRFIRRSLDVGLNRTDAIARWARNQAETASIEAQSRRYHLLGLIRASLVDDPDPEAAECFIAPLVTVSAGDLGEGRIQDFGAYRFLYERLIGPEVRPWLVSIFCAAAALPSIHPELRGQLLRSLPVGDAIAAGWSVRPPLFYPEWVEKVAEAVS